MLNIGCHVSSSKGYVQMLKDTLYIGGNTFAWFTRNPRGGQAKAVDPVDLEKFIALAQENNFTYLVAHAPYTLNLCSLDPSTRDFAIRTFKDDLKILQNVPSSFYNFHPGSHVGQGEDKGIELIIDALNEILSEEQNTIVLLETMAGKGSEVGRNFYEIKRIIDGVRLKDHIGVCIDTCHLHDGGYNVVSDFDGVLDEFDRIIGLDKLKAVHLNDSKNVQGSHKDRHECIGKGCIGLEALVKVINNPRLQGKPFILETPNELDGYKEEIALLKSLYTGK